MSDDVYILDSGDDVFVWVGKHATKKEKKMGMEVAVLYLQSAPDRASRKSYVRKVDRSDGSEDVGAFVVEDGKEPLYFTSLFHGWSSFQMRHGTLVKREDVDRSGAGLPLVHAQGEGVEGDLSVELCVYKFLVFVFLYEFYLLINLWNDEIVCCWRSI